LASATAFARRPALTHAVWLLVLLRLFAPPVWRVSLPAWPAAEPAARAVADAPASDALISFPLTRADLLTPPSEAAPAGAPADGPSRVPATDKPVPDVVPRVAGVPWPWREILSAAWLGGAVVCVAAAAWRVVAFRRLLRHAAPAPAAWQRT